MNTVRRTLACLLVFCLLCGLVPGAAKAGTGIAWPTEEQSRQAVKEHLASLETGEETPGKQELDGTAELLSAEDVELLKKNPTGTVDIMITAPGGTLASAARQKGLTLGTANSEDVAAAKTQIDTIQASILSMLGRVGVGMTGVQRSSVLVNAITGTVARRDLAKIVSVVGKGNVHVQQEYTFDLASSTEITGAQDVWASDPAIDGSGMTVGVIDTGVDWKHPDLGGSPSATFPTAKIVAGYDFGDDDYDPMDTNGHGTHVSGTIVANGAVKGMAPNAKLVIAKIVSGGEGSAWSDDIIAAFNYMADPNNIDGGPEGTHAPVTAVNMSFGSAAGFVDPLDPEMQAIENCVANGIVVTLSAGNSTDYYSRYGTIPWYPDYAMVGSPSVTPGSISVASTENGHLPYWQLTELSAPADYIFSPTGPTHPNTLGDNAGAGFQYVYCGLGGTAGSFPNPFPANTIALIERGTYNFTAKILYAANAGAVAVIVYNSASGGEGMINMAYPDGQTTIPAMFIQRSAGLALLAKSTDWSGYTGGDETGRIAFLSKFSSVANPLVDTVSTFSSWGSAPDLSFKPDLAAPGGNIWSTVPLAQEGYANYSGTSMAAPHVAGAAVLIRQAHPDWSVQQVKVALSNTSKLILDPWSNGGDGDLPYSPRLMGSGRINVADALATNVTVVQQGTNSASVALGSVENWATSPITFNLTLRNTGSTAEDVLSYSGTVQTTDSYKDAYTLGDFLTVTPAAFTLAAGASQTVTVAVDLTSLGAGFWQPFVEGFVTFHVDGAVDIHVPYAGFVGNWNDYDAAHLTYNPLIDPPEVYVPGGSLSRALLSTSTPYKYTGISWPQKYGTGWYLGRQYNGTFSANAIAINPAGTAAPNIENDIWILRNIEDLKVDIIAGDGTTLVKRLDDAKWLWKNYNWRYFSDTYPWYWDSENAWWLWQGEDAAGDQVPDGQYYLRNTATAQKVVNELAYDDPEILEFPVFVDRVDPTVTITSVTPNGANQTVTWTSGDAAPSSGIWGFVVWWSMNGSSWSRVIVSPATTSRDVPRGALVQVDVYDNAQNYGYSTEIGSMTVATTLPSTITVGAPAVDFTVTAVNYGEPREDVLWFGTLTTPVSWAPGSIVLEYYETLDSSWHTVPTSGGAGTLTFTFGPPAGFTFPAATTIVSQFRVSVAAGAAPGRVDLTLDLMRLDAADSPVGTPLAELNATTYAITGPLDIIATPDPLPDGYTHTTYTGALFTATGGIGSPYSFTATGVPAGLALGTNGTLSGTPTTVGDYTLHVTVSNAGGALTHSEDFVLHVYAGPGVTITWDPTEGGIVTGNPLPAQGSTETYDVWSTEGWSIGKVFWNGGTIFARDPGSWLTVIGRAFTFGPISGANTLHVEFDPSVKVTVDGKGGTVTPDGGYVVLHSSPSYTAKADPGYLIDTIVVDGVEAKAAANRLAYTVTFPNVHACHDIRVWFKTQPDLLPPSIVLPKFGTLPGVTGWTDGVVQTFYVKTSPFPLSFTLEDNSGSVKWSIKVNGRIVVDPSGTGLINYMLALTEGRNEVEITAADSAGNRTSQKMIIYLDTMPPALQVDPLPSSVASAEITVKGSAVDATSGLAKLTINGEPVTAYLDGSFSEQLTLVKGDNTIVVEAADKLGNTASQIFVVTYAMPVTTNTSSIYVVLTIGKTQMEVNGMTRTLDAAPFIKDGRTLLPIRALIEALGGTVQWNATTRTATITLGSRTVAMTIGSTTAFVNGKPVTLDVAPMIVKGRTFLPLRAVAENVGLDLAWEPVSRTISFTYWP